MTKITQGIIVGLLIVITIFVVKTYKELTYANSSLYDLRYRSNNILDILEKQEQTLMGIDSNTYDMAY